MTERGHFTYQEILSQPQVWASALETLDQQRGQIQALYQSLSFDDVTFTGCGSTYYLSLAAASLFQELAGVPSRGVPGSEAWLTPNVFLPNRNHLLLAVSRSGETTETLHACETFRKKHSGKLLTLSCYPQFPLASIGDVNLVFALAQEESIAQTRAFSTLYLATAYVSALWAKRDDLVEAMHKLPEIGQRLLEQYQSLTGKVGSDSGIERFYFLGSGSRYGLASELNLKMKEMSLSYSEAFHFMEFRHGPQSMANEHTLIFAMLSDRNRSHEEAVVEEMRARGARILRLAEEDADVIFAS
ncbi:MAG TPA: SIS domain-containing protein, partial [Longilinea sp.]|nr:SIS domain-containing protein [Longilinea sp.]